ncbi:MAG: HAD family phosphatase [Lachnospiraceae bacterium]
MLNEIQAVIFDMDGTLIDSMWIWTEIDVEFVRKRNLSLPDTYQKEVEGMSFTETAIYTKEFFHLPESVEELKAIWNHMALEKYQKEVTLKPGARLFLDYCKEQGILLGIATSNSPQLTQAAMEALNLTTDISVILTSCEVKKGKPAPDVYLEVAKRLHVSPKHCLVFEDIPMGIMAGKNAGMKVCAIEDYFSIPQREEKRRLADYYITSYEEVLENTYEVLENEI